MTADATDTTPTVETALDALSEAVGKASDDLRDARPVIERARVAPLPLEPQLLRNAPLLVNFWMR